MTGYPRVLHLVDDTTAGGVMRVLDFILSDPGMAQTGRHEVKSVVRGGIIGKLQQADVIVSHLTVCWRALPALIALKARNKGTPLLHVEHSYTEHFVLHNVANQRRFRTLLMTAYKLFDRVICVSKGQAAWMTETGLVRADGVRVIQSCVDLAPFRAVPARPGPVRVFGAIGRLDRQKGFDTLICAFRACDDPNIELQIIGSGDQEAELRALADGDDRIMFKAFHANTAKALKDIDVVVMPSRWEAYGLVAIEALAAGRKLLCSDIDGLRDHAELGGTLIKPASLAELSGRIASEANAVRKHDVIALGLAGRRLEERCCEGWRSVLGEVCGGEASTAAAA